MGTYRQIELRVKTDPGVCNVRFTMLLRDTAGLDGKHPKRRRFDVDGTVVARDPKLAEKVAT